MGKNRDDNQYHPEENHNPFETFFKKSPYPSQLLDQQGKIIQVNDSWLEEFRYNPDEVEGRQFLDFVGERSSAAFREWFENLQQKGSVPELELEVKGKNGNISSVSLDGRSHYDENNEFLRAQCILKETARESSTDPERELTLELLTQLNKATSLRKLMKDVTRLMQEWSGCEAVGVRLKKGEDYPYFETRGFDREFTLSENSLCEENSAGEIVRDPSGNPVLDCMCGNVIRGNTDPDKPFFSEKGSFWTNSTSDLLASTSKEDKQSRTRDHCNGEGYESVALVPLKHGDETFGLLQFNDSRRGKFDRSLLKILERLANNLTIAIKQRHDAQKLRESEDKFRRVFEEGTIGITLVDQDLNYININSRFCEMLGYKKDELLSRTFVDITHPADREKDKDAIDQLNNGKIPYYQTEKRYLRKDGEIIWCQTIATMVRRSNDLPDYFLAMTQDITERKRAKQKLVENKELLARAEKLAHLGSWKWEIEEGRFKLSEEWQKIHGWYRSELSRSDMLSTVHPDDRKRVKRTIKESRKNAEPYEIEHRIIRQDNGDVRTVKVYGEFVREDGRPVKMYGASLDITERKQQKEQLLKTHRRLKEIVDHSPDPIYIKDKKGRYLLLNEAAAEVLDVDAQSAVGKDDYDLFNSKDAELIRKDDLKVMDVGEPVLKERTYTVHGEEYVFIVNKYPYRDKNGSIIGIIGISHDITERKQIERELENSERRFRKILNTTSEGFWIANKEGNLLEANRAYADMVGYSQEELQGKKITNLEAIETPEETEQHIEEIIESGGDRFETRHITKTGDEVELEITVNYLENWEQFFCFIRDITERKRRERELNERRDELRKLSRRLINTQEEEMKRISRELHDELGQTLTGLSMNLFQMKEIVAKNGKSKVKSRLGESLELAEDLSDRLDEIVSELRPTMLDDLGLVPTLRWYLKKLNKRTDISIDLQLAELNADLTGEVETVLYRVTQEALTNVAKHSNADTARVKMDELDSGLQLSIEDDGRGFETNSLTSSKPKQGEFGLTGIRERLYAVNGRLQINSNQGEGTRLEITIPLGE
ncbi:PAS domain S-box protein [Candidatus Bipolaricaulota bacterium]|nr:PAS domain S-box protein [Candidatus Bipolaricaulota bacterium]